MNDKVTKKIVTMRRFPIKMMKKNWRKIILTENARTKRACLIWPLFKSLNCCVPIPTMRQGMTQFLITGDRSRNKLQTMPGGGYSTIKIELPRNWDTLMNELGYQPLYKYRL